MSLHCLSPPPPQYSKAERGGQAMGTAGRHMKPSLAISILGRKKKNPSRSTVSKSFKPDRNTQGTVPRMQKNQKEPHSPSVAVGLLKQDTWGWPKEGNRTARLPHYKQRILHPSPGGANGLTSMTAALPEKSHRLLGVTEGS